MKKVFLNKDEHSTTLYYPASDLSNWDDLRFPLTGQRLTVSAGRLDYNFTELTVDFSATARYPNEPVCMVAQMPHAKRFGSAVSPHLHWIQTSEDVPNWLMAYRWYNNGAAVPSTFTLAAASYEAFTYTSGDMMQITEFPMIKPPSQENVSSILDIRLYNDSGNASTLFDDAAAVIGEAKEFDLHYEIDSVGSGTEYVK